MASSVIYFQTMPSQGASTSAFNNRATKILCSSFKNICMYLGALVLQFQLICKDYLHVLFVCFCYTFGVYFFKKKPKKTSGVIIAFLWLKKNYFRFYWKERIENSLKSSKMDGYLMQWKITPNLLWRMAIETFFN